MDDISFTVGRGEIFGLLGPNGAGKTTTILMMLGLTEVTAGSVSVLGHDPAREPLQVKRLVGYLPDTVGFYDHMTALDNLRYTAALIGIEPGVRDKRIVAALDRVGLGDVGIKRVGAFSRGMRQRLGLAEILMKDVSIAILDEPTSGLDPHATAELLETIRSLKHDGVAVLLSSHLLERVQSVCDRVALFNAGRIALLGTVPELARQVLGGGYNLEVEADGEGLALRFSEIPGVKAVDQAGPSRYRLLADRDVRAPAAAVVVNAGGSLRRLSLEEPSLDAIYNGYFQNQQKCRERPMLEPCGVKARPGAGLSVVFFRELFDHLTSVRMLVLEFLVVLLGGAVVYFAAEQIRNTTAEDPFLFLRLFAPPGQSLLSFVLVLSILVPILAIGLGFDAINGEYNRRTMSRILAQPIYRDALLFGKFLAGLATISISLVTLWLLVDRLWPVAARRAAERRGDRPAVHLPAGDHRLCRDMAGAGRHLLGVLPLDRDRGAGGARPLAVPGAAVAGAGADAGRGDLALRPPLRPARSADARHADVAAGPVAHLARHALRRGRGGDAQSRCAVDDHACWRSSRAASARRCRSTRASCRPGRRSSA